MATEYKTTGYPGGIKPFPYPIDIESGRTPYTSLAEIIQDRPEPFWQEVHKRATLSVNKLHNASENLDSFEVKFMKSAALAVRALDHGMIDLPIEKRLTYLYGYVFEYLNDAAQERKFEDCLAAYFPTDSTRQQSLLSRLSQENGRYTRFKEYMQALSQIQAAGRPDILLSNNRSNSGIYSEFDYWVESQIHSSSMNTQVASTKELAQKIPLEFTTYAAMPMKERIYWIHYTRQKLAQTYNRLQPVLPTIREKQFDRLKAFLVPTNTGYQLTVPIEEVSQQLGLTHTNTKALIDHVRRTEGVTIDVIKAKVIYERTIVDAQHIIDAVETLEKALQVKWKYGQIPYEEVAAYITEKYPALGKMTRQIVNYVINTYLDSHAINLPQLPARRLEGINPAEVHNNIKRDILELIQSGHTHNAAQLALTLRIPGVTEGQVPLATAFKVIRMLKELEKEGEVIHWEENSNNGSRRTRRRS